MTATTPIHSRQRGATLVEAVIAVGVLAVAIPLVFGTIAEAGRTGSNAEAETRSTWILPLCVEEIQASRDGKSRIFPATKPGQAFPTAGDVWALAFADDGSLVGKLTKSDYDQGLRELDGKPVRYIASMSAAQTAHQSGTTPMLRMQISLEYPASARAAKRAKIDFHSRIP
jgi:Tfp pilus assembly protein PilV